MSIKMVVTDLDGTLLNSTGAVSTTDLHTLEKLGRKGVVRAIATGRSPFSYTQVLPDDFPVDYLIFSSGAGVLDLSTKELLYATEISEKQVQLIVNELMRHKVDFMVHEPIPSNHRFLYYRSGNNNPDFEQRLAIYQPFCQPFAPGVSYGSSAAQIIAILPHDVEWFEKLRHCFPMLKVIRATSPLDGHSIWMEIFRNDVSKALGINHICKLLNIDTSEVVTIGNDYNDVDMLNHYPNSFVVSNAPNELKEKYAVVRSNNDSGFSHAVEMAFGKL